MDEDVREEIENALNMVATTTERSGNMKKELKHTIYETGSTLRKLYVKLIDSCDGESGTITELETLVATTKAELEVFRYKTAKAQATPAIALRMELPRATGWGEAPSGVVQGHLGTEQHKLYYVALVGVTKKKRFKLTVTSKDSNCTDMIQDILKSRINPTDIRVGINSNKLSEMGMFK